MIKYVFAFLAVLVTVQALVIKDAGSHLLVCDQDPIELGIVLDSSSSIRAHDFVKGIEFLQGFLSQFVIGSGPKDVRVSIITFGKGVYPQDAFNLTTYNTKEEVIAAIGNIPHRSGRYTSTGEGIEYMTTAQLAPSMCRPGVPRLGIVITDGNSQEARRTKNSAQAARDSGIKMFAIGVGKVKKSEVTNIAGDPSRVVMVKNYDDLDGIKSILASQTCVKKAKPTTTPMPQTACGEDTPADIYFAFSPADLGAINTAWTTSFISQTVGNEEMEEGFRFGVVSGSCPDDAGFDLDDYSTAADIQTRVSGYNKQRVSKLVHTLTSTGYTEGSGGRADAANIAVLVAVGGKKASALTAEVAALTAMGVEVFIADPTGKGITIAGATTLHGSTAQEVSMDFVSHLCPA